MSTELTQVKKIDETTTIVQPCHIDDKRLTNASWTTQEGKFGQYDSFVLTQDTQSLAGYIQQYGNEKRYIYDLRSEYKYQLHDKWVNRYKKNKGELATTAEILQNLAAETDAEIEVGAEQREVEKIETINSKQDWIQGHKENMESQKATRQSTDALTAEVKELNRVLNGIVIALRQLKKPEL